MAWSDEQKRAFGTRLKELRGPRPQWVIADLVSAAKGERISERTIRNWEAGEVEPHWENLEAVARAMQRSVAFMIYGSDEPPQDPGTQLDQIERKIDQLLALVGPGEDLLTSDADLKREAEELLSNLDSGPAAGAGGGRRGAGSRRSESSPPANRSRQAGSTRGR